MPAACCQLHQGQGRRAAHAQALDAHNAQDTARCAYCACCVPAATQYRRTTDPLADAFRLRSCPQAAVQSALCGRRMSTGRHWGRILLPAPMGQSPAQHGLATPPCAICLTPPGLASERQPPAAVHLACFQRPGQYPLSRCVNNRSQNVLVCIPAQSRRLTQCTTCCGLGSPPPMVYPFKPCSSSS